MEYPLEPDLSYLSYDEESLLAFGNVRYAKFRYVKFRKN